MGQQHTEENAAAAAAAATAAAGAHGAATTSTTNSHLASLLSWLRSVGIWWDSSLVDIRAGCTGCSGPALGVFAVSDISENQLLCVIPRSAILSPRTSQLAAVLEAERLGGGLALTIAVMYEASIGPHSKWAGYFASLPGREYLPVFWSEAELELLTGTSLQGRADADRSDTQEDYEQHVVPLLNKYPQVFTHPERCSLDHFRTAASWVASRCFYVDSWHGDAMVPLADIFNHKASVVLLGDSWGVAELTDNNQHQHQHHKKHGSHKHSSDGGSDDDSDGTAGSEEEEEKEEEDEEEEEEVLSDEEEGGGEEEEEQEDGSGGDEAGDSDSSSSEEDAQHGFPVGGMPCIVNKDTTTTTTAAAAAAGGGEAATAATAAGGAGSGGNVNAGTWQRDGLNLQLEIGICSMGPPDDRTAVLLGQGAVDGTAAAAAAAAAGTEAGDAAATANGVAAVNALDDATGCVNGQEQQAAKRRKVESQTAAAAAQQPSLPPAPTAEQQQQQQHPEKRLEIVAASHVAAGAEVHNTYGELSNAQLVGKYGFCLPHNPFDEVQLCDTWAAFISTAAAAGAATGGGGGRSSSRSSKSSTASGFKPSQKLKQHVKWLQQHSNLLDESTAGGGTAAAEQQQGEEDQEPPEPPTITPGGRLTLMTAAVVRLLGATPSQLKSWQGLEDVLEQTPGGCDSSDGEDAPAAVPLAPGAAAAAAAGEGSAEGVEAEAAAGAGEEREAKAVSEHFEDVKLSQHDVTWWGKAGLKLLAAAVQRRLQQYPASLEHDRLALSQHQQQQQQQEGCVSSSTSGDGGAGEHAAAVTAALQLRVCEQAALHEVAQQVDRLLTCAGCDSAALSQ